MTQDQIDRLMDLMYELNWDLFIPEKDMPGATGKLDGMVVGTPERIKSLLLPQSGQMILKKAQILKLVKPDSIDE